MTDQTPDPDYSELVEQLRGPCGLGDSTRAQHLMVAEVRAAADAIETLQAEVTRLRDGIAAHREDFRRTHLRGSTSWDCDEALWALIEENETDD